MVQEPQHFGQAAGHYLLVVTSILDVHVFEKDTIKETFSYITSREIVCNSKDAKPVWPWCFQMNIHYCEEDYVL